MTKKILSVGQCGFDGPRIAKLFRSAVGAEVVSVDTLAEARSSLQKEDYDLVLVNRITFVDQTSGMDLVKELGPTRPVMLVSNYPEAQDEAEKLGAIRGFGKDALNSASTVETVRAALEQK